MRKRNRYGRNFYRKKMLQKENVKIVYYHFMNFFLSSPRKVLSTFAQAVVRFDHFQLQARKRKESFRMCFVYGDGWIKNRG